MRVHCMRGCVRVSVENSLCHDVLIGKGREKVGQMRAARLTYRESMQTSCVGICAAPHVSHTIFSSQQYSGSHTQKRKASSIPDISES